MSRSGLRRHRHRRQTVIGGGEGGIEEGAVFKERRSSWPKERKKVTWRDLLVDGENDATSEADRKRPNDDDDEKQSKINEAIEQLEIKDPAILEVRQQPRYRYTTEELMKLREAPLAKRKPDFFYTVIHTISIEHRESGGWSYDRKRSETPAENGPRGGDYQEHKRRPGDPRERIRKEQDRIVLSPQRESFNHGCCVPGRGGGGGGGEISRSSANRSHSPIGGGKPEAANVHVNSHQTGGARRIGSGRIVREPWDYSEKGEGEFGGFRREEQRYERRSFGRDFDKDKPISRGGGGKTFERKGRMMSEGKEEEPEWFSGGPVSQMDTIELRGFEDGERVGGKKNKSPANRKRAIEWAMKKKPQGAGGGGDGDGGKEKDGEKKEEVDKKAGGDASNVDAKVEEQQSSVNLEYFLSESIPKLLTNGVGGDGDASTQSRFKQWFSSGSSEHQHKAAVAAAKAAAAAGDGSRRSSLEDTEHVIKNLLKDIAEPSVSIPNDSSLYFAPISPANTTTRQKQQPIGANLMEMLQRGKQQQQDAVAGIDAPAKLMHLEEIEASIRQRSEASMTSQKMQPKSDEEMTAFKKLLAQMSGGQAITANNNGTIPPKTSHPMSIMEMLSHSQQQDEARMASAAHLMAAISPNTLQQQHELAVKLQQVQRQQQLDMLQKMMQQQRQQQQPVRASPLPMPPDVNVLSNREMLSRELLNRPEAQAILQAMHQRIPSPCELRVHTQNILQRALIKKKLEEQQENYRKKLEMQQRGQGSPGGVASATSPAPKSVSSPTPLTFTPTSVLRKMTADKDEKGGASDAKGGDVKGRAMTGGAAGIRAQQQQQQQQIGQWQPPFPKQPPGRPIVKANSNYGAGTPLPAQHHPQQQQEHYFQQQQQQQRLYQQQQLKMMQQLAANQPGAAPPNHYPHHHPHQYNHGPPPTPSQQQQSQQPFSQQQQQQQQQLTHQQLRAQHQQQLRSATNQQQQQPPNNQQPSWHQMLNSQQNYDDRNAASRPPPQPDNNNAPSGGDLSPTSNQLARWFSPNLLEKARAGKLPNMPTAGLSQHTLEEIERQTAAPVHN